MKEPYELTELIDQYLEGKLTGERLATFQQRLANEDSFREEVATQQKAREGLRYLGRQKRKQQLQAIHQEVIDHSSAFGSPESPRWWQRPFFRVAAMVVFFFGLLGLLYFFNQPTPESRPVLVSLTVEGTRSTLPAIPTLIYPPDDSYNFHYQFQPGDTLKLYGNFPAHQLRFRLLKDENGQEQYLLLYEGKIYLLNPTAQVTPLEERHSTNTNPAQ